MMTFYAAAGSYQIRSEDGKNMPYIMRLGKLQPVSIPEFSLWSMLLWDVLTYEELRKKFYDKMEETEIEPSSFDKSLEMLVKRKLIIKGVGYTGADALYNMLLDTYVIPLRGVQGTRKLMNVAKLLKQKKVNFFEAVYLLQPEKSSVAERRIIENSKQLGSDGVKISIPTTGNISVITQMAMDSGNYAPTGASYGEFTIMQMSGTPTAKASSFQKEDFVAKYALSNRTLTARELAMVPTLPDWYIIPKEVVRVCEHAKVTTASSQPMRNFLFRGEAGTGKTMGAQAIAAGLNLPYTLMTCSANTEITDLVGQFIPDTNGFHGSTPIEDLPKISDITMHPPSVYMMLTGEYDEEKTEDDVLQKLIEIAVGNLVEKEETPGQRICYVDTPLVEAIRHGYVCELQEPSCIANPGVLVGLNSLLDNCQVITLPTGERVKRHPDTVIVVTTNSDYSGCRDMNQSVISRMDLIYDMEAPDLNTMVKRVMNVTGFTDEQEATKMAIVVRDVAERCRQTMITDGSCGMREFKSWVLSTMVTHDPYESALSTIISSASADPDNRAELISACLEPQYSRTI